MGLPRLNWTEEERADLHIHSIYSDGCHTPDEIVRIAAEKNISVIALTDHACVSGIPELIISAAKCGIYAIPGIELNSMTLDILGYFIDYQHQELLQFIQKVNQLRIQRIELIISRLNALGYNLDKESLIKFSCPAVPCRTHIARILVKNGYFSDVDSVFNTLLGRGKPAYISASAPTDRECIRIIRRAGGIAIIAHPQYLPVICTDNVYSFCQQIKRLGAAGYETPLPTRTHPPAPLSFSKRGGFGGRVWDKAAEHFGLIQVCSSDFHGNEISGNPLGSITIGGDRLKAMAGRIPFNCVFPSFFKRMRWRVANLSYSELKASLLPESICLKSLFFTDLMSYQPNFGKPPADFSGIPYILIGPGALEQHTQIIKLLEQFNAKIIREDISYAYPQIAWTIYGMYRLPKAQKYQELFRFSLDRRLYGESASKCRIIFFSPHKDTDLRQLKQNIRAAVGQVKFYRVTYKNLTAIFLTTFVHMPDKSDIDTECWKIYNIIQMKAEE